jgi:hypothetical protein
MDQRITTIFEHALATTAYSALRSLAASHRWVSTIARDSF